MLSNVLYFFYLFFFVNKDENDTKKYLFTMENASTWMTSWCFFFFFFWPCLQYFLLVCVISHYYYYSYDNHCVINIFSIFVRLYYVYFFFIIKFWERKIEENEHKRYTFYLTTHTTYGFNYLKHFSNLIPLSFVGVWMCVDVIQGFTVDIFRNL